MLGQSCVCVVFPAPRRFFTLFMTGESATADGFFVPHVSNLSWNTTDIVPSSSDVLILLVLKNVPFLIYFLGFYLIILPFLLVGHSLVRMTLALPCLYRLS
jgi:hypothetical protein